jgi:transcriptional regulator with XRE-family HTH domain
MYSTVRPTLRPLLPFLPLTHFLAWLSYGPCGCILACHLIHCERTAVCPSPGKPCTGVLEVAQKRLADYIGLTVRKLRSDREFTLQALADESGISKSYLADIEKGRKNPTTDVIEAIAGALGVPARELLYHAALDEEDPFLEPEQLSLEEVAAEDAETRELAQLARRMRPADRRLLLEFARRLSR